MGCSDQEDREISLPKARIGDIGEGRIGSSRGETEMIWENTGSGWRRVRAKVWRGSGEGLEQEGTGSG